MCRPDILVLGNREIIPPRVPESMVRAASIAFQTTGIKPGDIVN